MRLSTAKIVTSAGTGFVAGVSTAVGGIIVVAASRRVNDALHRLAPRTAELLRDLWFDHEDRRLARLTLERALNTAEQAGSGGLPAIAREHWRKYGFPG